MQWSRIGHFFHEALLLWLRQGYLYEALVVLLTFCAVIVVVYILRLYLTKARMLGISAKEEARIKEEFQEKQKSGRLRY